MAEAKRRKISEISEMIISLFYIYYRENRLENSVFEIHMSNDSMSLSCSDKELIEEIKSKICFHPVDLYHSLTYLYDSGLIQYDDSHRTLDRNYHMIKQITLTPEAINIIEGVVNGSDEYRAKYASLFSVKIGDIKIGSIFNSRLLSFM